MSSASAFASGSTRDEAPALLGPLDDRAVTDLVCAPLLRPAGLRWWIAFLVCTVGLIATLVGVYKLFLRRRRHLGHQHQRRVGLCDRELRLVDRHRQRRHADLVAARPYAAGLARVDQPLCRGDDAICRLDRRLFPIFHLGRPLYFYWLAPYPASMQVWPQWRSALVWDFWAITSYLIFSIIFWYVGVLPDFATVRDRSSGAWRKVYGLLALGWRGSARHWRHYRRLQITLAALATPLVCSVHSIVGLDFAASLMPGWREPIFPPYFVVGAMYSGFAVVVMLSIVISRGLGLQHLITARHFEAMAKIMLMASVVMGLSYASEWFAAWYGGNPADRALVVYEFTGAYWKLYIAMLACNVVAPQLLWFPAMRASLTVLVGVSIGILVGMWLERILIIWNTLSHSFLPSMDRVFFPTAWDWLFLFGPVFVFTWMFLLFCRVAPVVPMHDVRELLHREGAG